MLNKFFWRCADPLVQRVAERSAALQKAAKPRREPPCAECASNVTLHPESRIENLSKNAGAIRIGKHSHLRGELLTFWNAGEISIGEWCYIGHSSRVWSQASITIGNHVLIAHLVDIHDTDSHPIDWENRRLDAQSILSGRGYLTPTQTISLPVVIEDDVWIGFKSTILKGVRIGRGAIIASASVVTKDVPPFTVVAGNPARVIRQLEPVGKNPGAQRA